MMSFGVGTTQASPTGTNEIRPENREIFFEIRISKKISRFSGRISLVPVGEAWVVPTPNDIIFGLLGSQSVRKQAHLGSGVPTQPPLAPTRSGPKTAK